MRRWLPNGAHTCKWNVMTEDVVDISFHYWRMWRWRWWCIVHNEWIFAVHKPNCVALYYFILLSANDTTKMHIIRPIREVAVKNWSIAHVWLLPFCTDSIFTFSVFIKYFATTQAQRHFYFAHTHTLLTYSWVSVSCTIWCVCVCAIPFRWKCSQQIADPTTKMVCRPPTYQPYRLTHVTFNGTLIKCAQISLH